MAVLNQLLATVIVCFPCLNMGLMYSWPSSTLMLFSSEATPLQRPMTSAELTLFGSMSSIGAVVGTPLAAVLLDRVGRKKCCILAGLTSVVSWAIIACTTSVEIVLAAVFIAGLSGASFLIVPVYLGEFCQEFIRGTLTSGSMVFYGVGSLVSYILGGYLSYMMMIYVAMASAAFEVATMAWLKESPVYLLVNGFEKEAAQSISFYRHVNIQSRVVTEELRKIKLTINAGTEEISAEEEKLPLEQIDININETSQKVLKQNSPTSEHSVDEKTSLWTSIRTSRPTQRGLLIALALMTSSMCQGLIVVQVYAEPLFAIAVPSVSPNLLSVGFAIAIVVASFAAAFMSDIAGRRPLMTYSSIASGLCCVLLGLQLQHGWQPSCLIAVVMYLFCAAYSFGGGTVPFVILAEVFLPEVKSFMTMLVVEWMWVCSFLTILVFNLLLPALGLGVIFHIFAAVCFLSAVFSIFCVPETKGLTLDAVQNLLQKTRQF